MASITLLLLSISTRQMKNANKTDNDKCTLLLLRRAVSSVSFSVFSRSTHTLVVMAVRAWGNGTRIYQQAAYTLMLNTGLRTGEALGLLNK